MDLDLRCKYISKISAVLARYYFAIIPCIILFYIKQSIISKKRFYCELQVVLPCINCTRVCNVRYDLFNPFFSHLISSTPFSIFASHLSEGSNHFPINWLWSLHILLHLETAGQGPSERHFWLLWLLALFEITHPTVPGCPWISSLHFPDLRWGWASLVQNLHLVCMH